MNEHGERNENRAAFLRMPAGNNRNEDGGLDEITRELEEKQCELILSSIGKYMNEEFAKKYDDWKEDMDEVDLPETLEYELRKITLKYEKLHKRKSKEKKRRGYIKVGGLILAVMVCAGGISLVESEALRERVYNIFFTPGDGHVAIEFRETIGDVPIPDDVKALMYPATLPVSYKLSEYTDETGWTDLIFTDETTEDWVMLSYIEADTILDIDTERSENRIIEINGKEAVIQNSKLSRDVYWKYGNYSVELTCSSQFFSEDEIIGIAENTRFYSIDELESLSQWHESE